MVRHAGFDTYGPVTSSMVSTVKNHIAGALHQVTPFSYSDPFPGEPVTFCARYFGRPAAASFGGNWTTGQFNSTNIMNEVNALRQTDYSNPNSHKRNGISFLIPVTSPDDVISGANTWDAYWAGHAYASELLTIIANVLGNDITLPQHRWWPKEGINGPILRVYLDIEPDKGLSEMYWRGFSDAVYWRDYGGFYPYYPCAYIWDNSAYAAHCYAISLATSGPQQCHGIWSAVHTACHCQHIRFWGIYQGQSYGPYSCANVAAGSKLWQTAVKTGWDCDGACGTPLPANFDINIDVSVEGDSEPFYMLFVRPYGPSDTGTSIYPDAIRGLAAFNILRNDPTSPTAIANRCEMAGFICRGVASGLTTSNCSGSNCACVGRTWDCEDWSSDPSTYFNDLAGVHPDLVRNIRTLKHYGVANGYGNGGFGPFDPVTHAQVISFITRAWVYRGRWAHQPIPGNLYGGALNSSPHKQDVATYVAYCGPVPGTSSTTAYWGNFNNGAQRQWFAQAEWRAIPWMGV